MSLTPPPANMESACSGCGSEPESENVGHTYVRYNTPYGDHLNIQEGEYVRICMDCMDEWEEADSPIPRSAMNYYSEA